MNVKDLKVKLERYPEDMDIAVVLWTVEDVKAAIGDNGNFDDKEFTENDYAEILSLVNENQDCTIGISWDIIKYWVQHYCDSKLENKGVKLC